MRENPPVALTPGAQGLDVVDSVGATLPIDPSLEPALDLPIADQRDVALTRMLGDVRTRSSVLYRRISEVSRSGAGDIVILLTTTNPASRLVALDSTSTQTDSTSSTTSNTPSLLRVRAKVGVSAARLTDIFPVEFDLRRRGARVAELDLRYRDQVIARLQ